MTIKEQRKEVRNRLADNPSLKALARKTLEQAYGLATMRAARETAIDEDGFPESFPWTFAQAVDDDFWPE